MCMQAGRQLAIVRLLESLLLLLADWWVVIPGKEAGVLLTVKVKWLQGRAGAGEGHTSLVVTICQGDAICQLTCQLTGCSLILIAGF